MRSRQSLPIVILCTVLAVLFLQQRFGCNRPAPHSRRSERQSVPWPGGESSSGNSGDAVRFDPDLVTHYSPDENLEGVDVQLLSGAQHTVDMAAYSLTDFVVANALEQAAHRGVQVRIYLDREQTQEESRRSRGNVLADLAGTPGVTLKVKHSDVLMHLKSYVVDGTTLRSGSANFSPTGEKRQDNDLTVTHNSTSVQAFEHHFDEMWSRPDNDPLPQ